MIANRPKDVKEKLIQAGVDLFRQQGYMATTVDEICRQAGVSKGAFFHYFDNKDSLGKECLQGWSQRMNALYEQSVGTPGDAVERLFACLGFFIGIFDNPEIGHSCLAGTIVQEVSETHPALREAAQACFDNGSRRFQKLLDEACEARKLSFDTADTAAVANLFLATIQGSIVLAKASRDRAIVAENLRHFRRYLEMLLESKEVV